MVRYVMLLIACVFSLNTQAQDDFSPAGMLSASATISPSWMLNRNESNYYLSGFAEYQLDQHVSFRGDIFALVGSGNDNPFVKRAYRTYFGTSYSVWKGRWGSFIGFQPGITMMESTRANELGETYGMKVSPSLALKVGTVFYVWDYFNFFANVTYVRSKLSGIPQAPFQTDELILSAGLGFNIQTKKR